MFSCVFKIIILLGVLMQVVYAAPCSPEKVKHELIKMKLDPEIKTNKDLLHSFNYVYGDELIEELVISHPFLQRKPNALIDMKTLFWLNKIMWSEKNKNVRYLYVAGDILTIESMDHFIGSLNGSFDSRRRTIPIFQHIESSNVFKLLLKLGGEQIVFDSFVRIFPDLDENAILEATERFTSHFREYNNYKIGFSDFSLDSRPVIEIIGHGKAGTPLYYFGDNEISAEQIVENIVGMKIPIYSTIKLTGCFTACKTENTSLSAQEIEQLFIQGNLKQIFDVGQDESFLFIFVKELKSKMPSFRGRVDGYIGAVSNTIESQVLTREGVRTSAFSVLLETKNGDVVLKREHARLSYDFSL